MAHITLLLAQANPNADPFLWYVTRTLAVGAYLALTISVLLGLLQSIARTAGERTSWRINELHIVLSVLAGVLMAGHVITLVLDPYLPFSIGNILIPLGEPFKPIPVDLGVLAFYGMIALVLSSYLKPRISYGAWRAIHYVSFAAFILVTAHGWLSGSDAVTNWMPAIYVGSSGAVGFLTFMRLITENSSPGKTAASSNKAIWSFTVALIIGVLSAGLAFQLANHG
jgi:methionine sulfoxide reductase heme-binding subunit